MRKSVKLYETVGANIKRLRLQKKISQQILANYLGLARPVTISEYEHGKTAIPLSTTMHIAEYFGVDIAELLKEPVAFAVCDQCGQNQPEERCVVVIKTNDDMRRYPVFQCQACSNETR